MKKLSIFLIILLVLTQFSITAVSNSGKNTIYVDDDNASGPWDGSQGYPFQFIQDGINAAEVGDTVFVYDGFYNEQILIDKTLNLQGESMEDTIIDGTGLGRLCTIEEANNSMVSEFTFQNAEPDAEALYIAHSTSVVIEKNYFTQNKDVSLYLGGFNNIFSENEIINNLYESHTIWVVSGGNTFVNNVIEYNKASGISIVAGNNIITRNLIKDNSKSGITLANAPSIKNTVISDNAIHGNNVGISVPYLTSYNVITNNTLSDNTKSGISFRSVRSTISYNTFENNPIGLSQGFESVFNNISHNTFASNTVGIRSIEATSNSFTENNFIKNTVHASFLNILPLWYYFDETIVFNSWNHNYWDNWEIGLPKPIFGLYCVVIPFCLFDKNPASEPFDNEAQSE